MSSQEKDGLQASHWPLNLGYHTRSWGIQPPSPPDRQVWATPQFLALPYHALVFDISRAFAHDGLQGMLHPHSHCPSWPAYKYLLKTQAYVSPPLKNLPQLDLASHFEIPPFSADHGQSLTDFEQEGGVFCPLWGPAKETHHLAEVPMNGGELTSYLAASSVEAGTGLPWCLEVYAEASAEETDCEDKILKKGNMIFLASVSLLQKFWCRIRAQVPVRKPGLESLCLLHEDVFNPTLFGILQKCTLNAKPMQLFLVLYPNYSGQGSDHGKNSINVPRTSSFPNKRAKQDQQVSLILCHGFFSTKHVVGVQWRPADLFICLSYLTCPHLPRVLPFYSFGSIR